MGEQSSLNLTNHFLIAMPGMLNDSFDQSLIYICEHNAQGALGLVINKPIDITLQQLFEKVDLEASDRIQQYNAPVYYGGPVQVERGFVLHIGGNTVKEDSTQTAEEPFSATLQVTADIGMTSSKDILEAIAQGKGPDQFLIVLGYAGWGAGQLEGELAQNSWLTVKARPEIIFDIPAADRYNRAMALLGITPQSLVSTAGHA